MTAQALAAGINTSTDLVLPLVNGLLDGAVYGLMAIGLVLLYKSNKIFNFAQGEFATVAPLTAYMWQHGSKIDLGFVRFHLPRIPFWWALILGLIVATGCGAATQYFVIQPMFSRPRVVVVVGTVGVSLLLIGIEGMVFPFTQTPDRLVKHLGLPVSGVAVTIDRIGVRWGPLLALLALAVLALLTLIFFTRTATGSAILAVSMDATAARGVGINVTRLSLFTWSVAGLIGGIAGLLYTETQQVTPGIATGVVLVPGFAAAVLGGMTSLPGAFAGGLLLGLVSRFASLDGHYIPLLSKVAAPSEFAVLLVLLVVLAARPRGLFGKEA